MSTGPIGPIHSGANLLPKTEFSNSQNIKGSLQGIPITLVSPSSQRQEIGRRFVKERIFSSLLERISTPISHLFTSIKKSAQTIFRENTPEEDKNELEEAKNNWAALNGWRDDRPAAQRLSSLAEYASDPAHADPAIYSPGPDIKPAPIDSTQATREPIIGGKFYRFEYFKKTCIENFGKESFDALFTQEEQKLMSQSTSFDLVAPYVRETLQGTAKYVNLLGKTVAIKDITLGSQPGVAGWLQENIESLLPREINTPLKIETDSTPPPETINGRLIQSTLRTLNGISKKQFSYIQALDEASSSIVAQLPEVADSDLQRIRESIIAQRESIQTCYATMSAHQDKINEALSSLHLEEPTHEESFVQEIRLLAESYIEELKDDHSQLTNQLDLQECERKISLLSDLANAVAKTGSPEGLREPIATPQKSEEYARDIAGLLFSDMKMKHLLMETQSLNKIIDNQNQLSASIANNLNQLLELRSRSPKHEEALDEEILKLQGALGMSQTNVSQLQESSRKLHDSLREIGSRNFIEYLKEQWKETESEGIWKKVPEHRE
jgi:hypothetical protein